MARAVTPPGLAEGAPFALQVPLELIGAYAERFPGGADPGVLATGAAARARGYYTLEEFVALCRWKSPRSAPLVARNSARDVEAATRTALARDTPERERIEALLALRGVGWPTASVLLHVADPDGYPILDVRALQALGVARAPAYSFRFWAAYRAAWQDVRERAGVDGRTLDRALWQWSKEHDAHPKEKAMENTHARAVRFDRYGGRDVLYVADVPMPVPAAGEVVVEVRAAGINPGEAAIRTGALHERWPATFPSGQGSDLAGVVSVLGEGVTEFAPGDEVLGWSWARSSHATHAAVPVTQLVAKPPQLSWPVAGALYVVGVTAYAAVRAVDPQPGDTVAVSAAAGGVGTVVVQLLALRGVRVLGIASAANDGWLSAHGAAPVHYGAGLRERLNAAAPRGIDAFIDLFGPEYLEVAADLGIAPDRIETIIAAAKAREIGAKMEGSADASTREVLTEMAGLVADGSIEVPIAATYPLDRVADAFAEVEQRHTRGKIVLVP